MNLDRNLFPDLRDLQAFECAARHGSFTQAARELHLTQSAVSRQIKELETRLGVLLFERVRQRVVLSSAGQKFLADARRLLSHAEETVLRAMGSAQGNASLSIATLPTFGSRWLMPRIPRYLQRAPGTVLNIAARSEPFDFSEQPFDLAIHYGQPVWAQAQCEYLCSEMMIPVASPEFIASYQLHTLEAFPRVPLLHMASRPKVWQQWFDAQQLATSSSFAGHRFELFSMVIEAAAGGLGMALVPTYLVEPELQSGQLAIVTDAPLQTENNYYLVVPETEQENPVTRGFCEWVKGEVRG